MASRSTRYTEEQQNDFVELAQDIGIGRAIRELGYPSYPAAVKWCKQRGVKVNVDALMKKAKDFHIFYETQDLLVAVDNAMTVVEELFAEVTDPDGAKKLAEAMQKLVNTRQVLEGKATTITEKRETTQQDLEIAELLAAEQLRNRSLSFPNE